MDMNVINMAVKTLTVGQLRKVCTNNKYIILRHSKGFAHAINCAIEKLSLDYPLDTEPTNYVSYYACSFDEYITRKVTFIAPK